MKIRSHVNMPNFMTQAREWANPDSNAQATKIPQQERIVPFSLLVSHLLSSYAKK